MKKQLSGEASASVSVSASLSKAISRVSREEWQRQQVRLKAQLGLVDSRDNGFGASGRKKGFGRPKRFTEEEVQHYQGLFQDFVRDMPKTKAIGQLSLLAKCSVTIMRRMVEGVYFKTYPHPRRYSRNRPGRPPGRVVDQSLAAEMCIKHNRGEVTVVDIAKQCGVSLNTAAQVASGEYHMRHYGPIDPDMFWNGKAEVKKGRRAKG